jgi:hypothetical protein
VLAVESSRAYRNEIWFTHRMTTATRRSASVRRPPIASERSSTSVRQVKSSAASP